MSEQQSALLDKEQERQSLKSFWRWNVVVILLVLAVGYEMLMGQMLWRQLKPYQSALAERGIKMEVHYKQMHGSKIFLEHPFGKVEIKLSHQIWTLATGDFYRGTLKGNYQIGAAHEKFKGTMEINWQKNLELDLMTLGNEEFSPSQLSVYLPSEMPKRFVVKLNQGGIKSQGVNIEPWAAVLNENGIAIPSFKVERGKEVIELLGLHFESQKPVLTIEQVAYLGNPVFKDFSMTAGARDGVAEIELKGEALEMDKQPFVLTLKQNVGFWAERMMQNPALGGWLIYPIFLDQMFKNQASVTLNVGDKALWAEGVANAKGIDATLAIRQALWSEEILGQYFKNDDGVWRGRIQFDVQSGKWEFIPPN
ncbi:MAG: hypothetical protein Q4B71_04265 [Cardiobacteriaceae bacterium]|nr:hypothetical protein [Cardiobacteriaceae bacterium]